MIVLDYRDSRPLYQQVKDSLRRMMLTGLLEPDEKLPSVRLSGYAAGHQPQHHPAGLRGAGGGGVHLLCGGQRGALSPPGTASICGASLN